MPGIVTYFTVIGDHLCFGGSIHKNNENKIANHNRSMN